MQHRSSPGTTSPLVGIDYFFITAGGVKKRDELEYDNNPEGQKELEAARVKGEVVKCLVVRCNVTKVLFGHVVPCKGPDENEFVAGTVVDDIKWLGHTKLVINADGEPAVQALVELVLRGARVEC